MSTEHERLNELFSEALGKATPEEREVYLAEACGSNRELRGQLDSLLLAHSESGNFLRQTVLSTGDPPLGMGPGNLIGRYKLLQQIGEGGFGVVFMAEQQEPVRRMVALKVIKTGMDTREVVARFEAERQALALMDHPNIARVLDGGVTESGRPYFVMDLVKGVPITEFCDRHQLPIAARLRLFMKVCAGVQHAHQKGIIHRDLKPTNVLVTLHDGEAVPKVIDFGVAKAIGQKLTERTLFTRFEQLIGTPAYMSPEQAEWSGLDIDTRSDIYSLGVLLYELLTGTTPLDKEMVARAALDELRRLIRETEPPKPSARLTALVAAEVTRRTDSNDPRPEAKEQPVESTSLRRRLQVVRGDLDWIVMTALEKDRTRRYETVNGLARDIERHLNGEPVVACPPSKTYRAGKFIRNHRVGVAAVTGVVLALMVGLGFSYWTLVKERDARHRAVAAENTAKSEANRAEHNAEENRERLVHEYIERGIALADGGDSFAALPWLAEAQKLDTGRPERQAAHQLRFQSVLQRAPKLYQVFFHGGKVRDATFSPDGLRVATASSDGTAQVWSIETGSRLFLPLQHTGAVHCVAFSPDGKRLLTASEDRTARVWDALTGQPVTNPLGHANAVVTADFSSDASLVVTGCADGTVQLWDAGTGKGVGKPIKHKGQISNVELGRAGRLVVTRIVGDIIDTELGPIASVLQHTYLLPWAVFDTNGQRPLPAKSDYNSQLGRSPEWVRKWNALAAGSNYSAQLWDATDGESTGPPARHDFWIRGADVSTEDAKRIASPDGRSVMRSFGGKARVWDIASGKPLTPPLWHMEAIQAAAFDPSGRFLVTGSRDGVVRVWDLTPGADLVQALEHSALPLIAAFSPNGDRLATTSSDETVQIWDGMTGRAIGARQKPEMGGKIYHAAFSPDGRQLAAGGHAGGWQVWDVNTGSPRFSKPPKHADRISGLTFSPDSRVLATASHDGTVRLWDTLADRELTNASPLRHQTAVRAVAFSPDGKWILTGSGSDEGPGLAQLWNVLSGEPAGLPLRHQGYVGTLAFSPNGQRIATGGNEGCARIWNPFQAVQVTPPLRHEDQLSCLAFSPDGARVLTAGQDGTARLWNAVTGAPLSPPLRHTKQITLAAFSPEGRWILTGSYDATARLWDGNNGEPATPARIFPSAVFCGGFDPHRSRVAIPCGDGRIYLWDIPDPTLTMPDLRALAGLLSGHKLEATGGATPLTIGEFRQLWNDLRPWLPHLFSMKELRVPHDEQSPK